MQGNDLCPCCSGKRFRQCCHPFLSGKSRPGTAKQLMRSRYTAFALGNQGHYLLNTWHPSSVPAVTAEELGESGTTWCGLEILRAEQSVDNALVEFEACWTDEAGVRQIQHEVSEFVREQGNWYYLKGKVE